MWANHINKSATVVRKENHQSMNSDQWHSPGGRNTPSASTSEPIPLGGRIFLRCFGAAGFVAKVLVVAFFATLIAGPLGFLFRGVSAEILQGYTWLAGAMLAIIGIPAGWIKFGREAKAPPVAGGTMEPASLRQRLLGGALIGTGMAVWGSCLLLLCWLSLGRCPLLPASWHEALTFSGVAVSSRAGSGYHMSGGGLWMPVLFVFGATFLGAVFGAILLAFLPGSVHWRNSPPGSVRHRSDPANNHDAFP